MEDIGRSIAAMGFVVVAIGAIVWCIGRVAFNSELSEELIEQGERVRPSVLFASSLLLSVILSAALLVMQWMGRR